jgi:DNA-binding LytR/AlgR family response regulator
MRIVIIEDEIITAEDLAQTIRACHPSAEITKILGTVKESVAWLSAQPEPDLIFSDIQLGDGLSFEIFSAAPVPAPVIFCTAYDEYALNAFQANGIDYILKPFTTESVAAAIKKYLSLSEKMAGNALRYKLMEDLFRPGRAAGTSSILVYQKDQIVPIAVDQIAFFYLKRGVVFLTTFHKEQYPVNKSLDELGEEVGPSFFRTNRQFLVNRKAVLRASSYLSRKLSVSLSVPTEESVTVSKEKMTEFLDWLSRH